MVAVRASSHWLVVLVATVFAGCGGHGSKNAGQSEFRSPTTPTTPTQSGPRGGNGSGSGSAALFVVDMGDPIDVVVADGKVFATNGSQGSARANRLLELDPVALTIKEYDLGGEPRVMEPTRDGQFLYVAVGDEIVRFDLASRSVGQRFTIPPSFVGDTYPITALDIAAIPGQPLVIAVARGHVGLSPPYEGVIVYDDGVKLPDEISLFDDSPQIEAGEPAVNGVATIFAYDSDTTEFGFRRHDVDGSGATQRDETFNVLGGFEGEIKYDAGRLYSPGGEVVDPTTDPPSLVGTYPSNPFTVAVAPDSSNNRVYFLDSGGDIDVFDQAGFSLVRSIPVTLPSGSSFAEGDLVRWGANGLAFRTDNAVVMFSSPLVGP